MSSGTSLTEPSARAMNRAMLRPPVLRAARSDSTSSTSAYTTSAAAPMLPERASVSMNWLWPLVALGIPMLARNASSQSVGP